MAVFNKRAAIKKLKKLVFTPKTDLAHFRDNIEKEFANPILPHLVTCKPVTVHGIPSDMLIPQVSSNKRMILYIHGGSYMGGSRVSWRNFCASFADESASRLLLPDYRLAPGFAFPAGIEDVIATYKRMCNHHVDVFLAGDGSGAQIALAAALSIPKNLKSFLKGIVLFSPWVDVSKDSLMYSAKIKDPLFNAEIMRYCSAYYTFSSNFENPLVSPLKADTKLFEDFPPVYIQMGSEEMTRPCVRKLATKLTEAGVNCKLDIEEGMFHFYQFVDKEIPIAHLAVAKAGEFIKNIKTNNESQEEEEEWN